MGRERGRSGTHILKDFELQRRGIQVIEFPCKGRAHVREGCLTDAAPCSSPVSPQASPATQKTHTLSKQYLDAAL